MNPKQLEKINELIKRVATVLREDIESDDGCIDPLDHLTALSLMLCTFSIEAGFSREQFLGGITKTYDSAINNRGRHATND